MKKIHARISGFEKGSLVGLFWKKMVTYLR